MKVRLSELIVIILLLILCYAQDLRYGKLENFFAALQDLLSCSLILLNIFSKDEWPVGPYQWTGGSTASATLYSTSDFITAVPVTTPDATFGPNITSILQVLKY